MVIPGLIARVRVLQISLRRSSVFLIGKHQIHFGHFVEHEIREGRFVCIVWSAHLNSESDSLVILLRQFKDELQIAGELQAPWPWLYFPPCRTHIKLLTQGKSNQVLDLLRNIVGLDFLRATVCRDIGDQSHTIVGHHVFRGSSGHYHVVGRNDGIRRVLRERTLIQSIGQAGTGAEVVVSPVVGGNVCLRPAHSQICSYANDSCSSYKVSTPHGNRLLQAIRQYHPRPSKPHSGNRLAVPLPDSDSPGSRTSADRGPERVLGNRGGPRVYDEAEFDGPL